jgi:uncharacterized membrane protein (UPF0127 family)
MTAPLGSSAVVARTGALLARRVAVARTRRQQMVGLLARARLEEGEALLLPRCRSIHTWGMRFPIDVAFVDRAWRVVALRQRLGPWRIVPPVWSAWGALELEAGAIARAGLRLGDALRVGGEGTACDTGASAAGRP